MTWPRSRSTSSARPVDVARVRGDRRRSRRDGSRSGWSRSAAVTAFAGLDADQPLRAARRATRRRRRDSPGDREARADDRSGGACRCSWSGPATTSRSCAATSSACCSTPKGGRGSSVRLTSRRLPPSNLSVDDWAVVNAIGDGDAARALRETALRLDRGDSVHMLVGQLRWWVSSKLSQTSPQRVRPAIEALLRTDLALKSSAATNGSWSSGWSWSCRGGKAGADRPRAVGAGDRREALLGGGAASEARLVAAGRVVVNDALGGHLVHDRERLAQGLPGLVGLAGVDGGTDGLEGGAQPGRSSRLWAVRLRVCRCAFTADACRVATSNPHLRRANRAAPKHQSIALASRRPPSRAAGAGARDGPAVPAAPARRLGPASRMRSSIACSSGEGGGVVSS